MAGFQRISMPHPMMGIVDNNQGFQRDFFRFQAPYQINTLAKLHIAVIVAMNNQDR